MYKEKRMERAEGTTTIAILLRTTSRDAAYIKVIVIRQTEYKDSPGKSPVIHVTDSLYYHAAILYWEKYGKGICIGIDYGTGLKVLEPDFWFDKEKHYVFQYMAFDSLLV